MKDELIEILETFGYPVIEQGTLGENEEYPNTFFTFWNDDSYDGSHYDNSAVSWVWQFDVNVYSTDPNKVNSLLLEAKAPLVAAGWIISGKGHNVASDVETHTGRGMTALFVERNKEE